MKKLLALVLALVMTLSLCVVSSNAAFDDAADIDYKEAVDVLSAVGVFVGDGSGNFYPDQQLTREQAAKVIAYLDLGESVAEALPSIGTFSDVSSWANKYVDYLANAKIVNGIGGGKFGGANQVTGYEFAKMLLVVLGWDADIEGMTGSAWQIGVAKLVKEYKLAKGYSTNLSAPLTREAAAKLTFNAIQRGYVVKYEYDGGFTVKENELSYRAKGEAIVSTKLAAGNDYGITRDNDLFFEKHWTGNDDLYMEDGNNSFGAPYTTWKFQNKKIGTYTDEPVLTFTEKIKYSDLYTKILEAGYKFDTDKATDYTVDLTSYTNGYARSSDTVFSGDLLKAHVNDKQKDKAWANYTGTAAVPAPIMTVDVYANSDGYVTDIALVHYELAEVTGKVEDKASTTLVDESELTFAAYTGCNADKDPAGFAEVYAAAKKGDKVLVAVSGEPRSTKIVGVKLPTVVEGKITKANATELTIDGTTYKTYNNTNLVTGTFNSTTTYKAWVDENGFAYETSAKAANGNIYGILAHTNILNADNEVVPAVKVIKADGTEATLVVADRTFAGMNVGALVALTENTSTNKYEVAAGPNAKVKTPTANLAKNAKTVNVSGTTYALTGDCKVIYMTLDGTDAEYTVSSKVQATTISSTQVYAVLNSDNKVSTLFIGAAADTTVSDVKSLIYVEKQTGTGNDVNTKGKDFTYYTYDAYIDGEYVEIKSVTDGATARWYKTKTDSVANGCYKLDTPFGGDSDYNTASGTLYATDVTEDTFVMVGITGYGITDSTKVASSNEAIEATTYAQVQNLLNTAEYRRLTVKVLYDVDTNNVLYLYITDSAVR